MIDVKNFPTPVIVTTLSFHIKSLLNFTKKAYTLENIVNSSCISD